MIVIKEIIITIIIVINFYYYLLAGADLKNCSSSSEANKIAWSNVAAACVPPCGLGFSEEAPRPPA